MARLTGTPEGGDRLFGTRRADLIRGLGGRDTLDGNGGADTFSGGGDIDGDGGADRWFSIYADNATLNGTEVELGPGRDLAVIHNHDPINDITNFGGFWGLETGDGADRVILGHLTFATTVFLGRGADRAWLMSDAGARISLGEGFANGGDGQRDVLHVAGDINGTTPNSSGQGLSVYGMDAKDLLVLYNTGLNFRTLRQATQFVDSEGRLIDVFLPSGGVIRIQKEMGGKLKRGQVKLVDDPLTLVQDVLIENDARLTTAVFGSSADDRIAAKGRALFLAAGDDVGRGSRRAEEMRGESGDDRLLGRGGNDSLHGGTGDDTIVGGGGQDLIRPGAGDDVARGGGGGDRFVLVSGDDTLHGQAGDDVFLFDPDVAYARGVKIVHGGGGRDRYVMDQTNAEQFLIMDFRPGVDQLDFRGVLGIEDDDEVLDRFRDVDTPDADRFPNLAGAWFEDFTTVRGDIFLAGVSAAELGPEDILT